MTGKASRRGDFLDHVLDRYADVLMLGGLAIGPYCPVWLGLLAVLGIAVGTAIAVRRRSRRP